MATASLPHTKSWQSHLKRLRSFTSWAIFPAVFGASLAVALLLFGRGVNEAFAVAAISGVVGMVLMALEYIQPHAHRWQQPQGDVGTDVAHLMFSTMLVPAVFEALFRSGLLIAAAWLASYVGPMLWPTTWPLLGQLALALVVAEFGQYWWHRLAHQKDLLWRFHATHHSSGRLYWLNSCRFHPVDSLAQYALEVAPLILLGCPGEVIALFTLCTSVIGMFQHANIRLKLGPLNWIFSMTELHRWHHSCDLREANSNYGANLILWDVVFGTRYLPVQDFPAHNVGLANMPNFPQRYLAQLASPFRWRKLREEANRTSDS